MFVASFQLLTESLRSAPMRPRTRALDHWYAGAPIFRRREPRLPAVKEEYFFDRAIADMLIENHFDSSHNTFESIRRVADIWEWGNTVVWPGFFANLGPCDGALGSHSSPGRGRRA